MILDLSYLRYPLPSDITMLFESGRFEEMERLIELNLSKPELPAALKKHLEFLRYCAEDIREAYQLTSEQAFDNARKRIPDLTRDEFHHLRDDRTLDWRYIDGKRYYRNNCINNLLRTRRPYALREKGTSILLEEENEAGERDHLIHTLKEKGRIRYQGTMQESISVCSDRLTPGETLRFWLPLPVRDFPLVSSRICQTSHPPVQISPENAPQRTAYFEVPYEKNVTVAATLAWETEMVYRKPDPALATGELPAVDVTEQDLAQVEPHIVFAPYLKALTREIVGDTDNPIVKARRIYDFITTQGTYRFMPSYRSIPDIVGYFCANLHGDCGVQALTFITMCRCCGVPARWQSGLYTSPASFGMHDWTMFYAAPYGWLHADCSFGGSAYRNGAKERHDFYFGNLDPWRLPFASRFQYEFTPPTRFMRADPYDNQVGEAESLTRRLFEDELDKSHNLLSGTLCD